MRPRLLLLLSLTLASSCQCTHEPLPEVPSAQVDAGTMTDAGTTTDASVPVDAGATLDAGTTFDAGVTSDSGTTFDAGVTPDSGTTFDAGTNIDAGVDAGVERGPLCEQGGWCWQRPLPFGHSLFASWGSGPSDVWAVGAHGAIARFDGANWRLYPGVTRATLYGIWGSGPNNVWAVGEQGTLLHFNGTSWSAESPLTASTLRSVHGSSSSNVYAVGDDEAALHFDGAHWASLPPLFNLGFAVNLNTVFAFANTEVWAAGSYPYGAAHRGTDGGWSVVSISPFQEPSYSTLWGADPSDVWLSGAPGAATERWDGGSWKNVYPRSLEGGFDDARTITGSSAHDVWFFGGWGDSVGHWDGARFWPAPELQYEPLTTGWVHDSGAGWAFGYGARMARKSAVAGPWSMVGGSPSGSYDTMYALAVVDDHDIWLGGRLGVAHWNGSSWTDVPMAETRYRVDVADLYAAAANDVWLVGYSSTPEDALQHFDGASWKTVSNPGTGSYTALWASGPQDVWVKGEAELLHFDGHTWSTQVAPAGGLFTGTSSSNFWVAGYSGKTFQYNGSSWAPHPTGLNEDPSALLMVSASEVWVATFEGHLLRWSGSTWVSVTAPATVSTPNFIQDLKLDAHGDVWVTGSAGDTLRWSNGQWHDEGSTGVSMYEIAFTSTGTIWLAGENGAALRR